MNAFILLLLGLLLVFIEFYIPGAVMGVLGSLLILSSLVVFILEGNSIMATLLFMTLIGISVAALIKFALWRIRRAKPDRSIYSDDSQEGFQASSFDSSAIGKEGVVLSDLKPGGYILVDGKQHQAISQSGYLSKSTKVIVIGGQEESLVVKLKKEST